MTRVEKLKALCLANIFIVLNDFLYAYKNGKKNKPKYKECLVRCEGHLYDFSIFSPFKNILFTHSGKYKIIISKVLSRGRRQADYGSRTVLRTKTPTSGGPQEQPKPKAEASLTFPPLVWKKDQQSHHSLHWGEGGNRDTEIGNKCRESKNDRSFCKYPPPNLPL